MVLSFSSQITYIIELLNKNIDDINIYYINKKQKKNLIVLFLYKINNILLIVYI